MVAWKGTQKTMKQRSASPRFRMNRLVLFVFSWPLRMRTASTRQFPTVPTKNMIEKMTEIITDSTFLVGEK